MSSLNGRVVAITGASAGIGLALARRLIARGASVAAFARRTDRLEALAAEAATAPGQVLIVTGDVTQEADVRALVDRTVDRFGRLDVMVCNAGIGYHGTLEQTPIDVMRRMVDVNLMGTLYAAQAALTVMRPQGHGHIIAVASIVARRGVSGSSVYGATKGAQLSLIESLRAEFAGTRLHASVVLPVSTVTEFHQTIARDYGHRVQGRGPKQSADRVAGAILDCIVTPRAEVYPMRLAWLLSVMNVVAPALTDRFVRRFGRQQLPAAETDAP
jgi:short-subunit dehydrogenase